MGCHSRYTHPIQVGWCSRNAGAVASRTVNASVYNMCVSVRSVEAINSTTVRFVQASSIVASQIYRKDDAPMCGYCHSLNLVCMI
jgi:hypothetical protein